MKDNAECESRDASNLVLNRTLVAEPLPESSWASEMVLNPGLIRDPVTKRWHMLFRATGPYSEKATAGQPNPFPIFLGYAWSDTLKDWNIDFSRPALAPKLAREIEDIKVTNCHGESVVNYANGCIEDPRIFFLENECFVSVACRMFPPGPYWIKDDPVQCAPSWIGTNANKLGKAASENVTVNVLFKVSLNSLSRGQYDEAFEYVCHVTDPDKGENRDVIFFPEKLDCGRGAEYVQIHRPWNPSLYSSIGGSLPPSMTICSSPTLHGFASEQATQTLLAAPAFDWDCERIGASGPLVKIGTGEWLLSYHGKQSSAAGYTQSFMIIKHTPGSLPRVLHRSPARVLYPKESWEMPGRFKSPVIFITGMEAVDGRLLVAYGAADQRVGIAELNLADVVRHTRKFDAKGLCIKS